MSSLAPRGIRLPGSFSGVVVGPPERKRQKFPFTGHVKFHGIDIDIENRKGSVRSGVDKDGHRWHTKMHAHYGEIRHMDGVDGDKLDVYVMDNADSPLVVVVHQNDPLTGKYDEDKVILGAESISEALKLYRSQYDRPGFFGGYTAMPIGALMRWMDNKKNSGKRLAPRGLR